MGLPTCSIRALPEHHQLLRRIGRALVTHPELSESLMALIEGVTQDVTRPNTAVDQRFEDVERRLARLEAEAVLRSETQTVLPQRDTRDTVPQHDPPAVTRQPPVPRTQTPRPSSPVAGDKPSGASSKRRPPRPWTEADDAELRRIFDQGGTQADACREMDRPSSVISPKWWKLVEEKTAKAEAGEGQPHLLTGGLTAIPDEHSEEAYLCQIAGMTFAEAIKLKGWTCEADNLAAAVERWREKHPPQAMLPIEWTRQVEAMQEAGRSAEEIKAWLDLRKASKQPDTTPASHVDENPAPPVEPLIESDPARLQD
jgi:hypothetical protein